MKVKAFLVLMLCSLASNAVAQVKIGNNGKISGLVFGDYYWIASDHNSDLKGNNGFWIRRIYFTYDQKISKSFSTRFRLEMNSEGNFMNNAKLHPYVKDAYLKWTHNRQNIIAGLSPTPASSFVVSVWGYRSVEKTALVLQKMAGTRSLGLSFKGDIGENDDWHYFFMFGNGGSVKTGLNKDKKFMLSLAYNITDRITIQAYGGWDDESNRGDIYTTQGFLAYQTKEIHVGILYAHQIQQKTLSGQNNLVLNIASIFASFNIINKIKGLLRVDHLFEANPVGENISYIPFSSQAQSTLLIAGADIKFAPKVHLIPNIETVVYGQTSMGTNPLTDVIPKLTLYYNF
jgi:hypothetical protein